MQSGEPTPVVVDGDAIVDPERGLTAAEVAERIAGGAPT